MRWHRLLPFLMPVAAAATLLGCEPSAGDDPAGVEPAAVVGTAEGAAAEPPVPPPPTVEEIRALWADELAVSEEAFASYVADRRAAEAPVTLFGVPLGGGASDPLELPPFTDETLTQERYCGESVAFWKGEVAAYAAARPLTESGRAFLDAVAAYGQCPFGPSWEEVQELAGTVRAAGTDDPLVRAHLAWERAGDGGTSDEELAELAAAADAVLGDENVPGLYRHRATYWSARSSRAAEMPNADERIRVAADGLRAFAASVTPEAADALPQLPRILYQATWDLLNQFDEDEPDDDAPRRLILAALSDAAAGGGDPHVFHVVAGDFLIDSAWDARGTSFADKVAEEDWVTFHADLAAAAEHLHAAWRGRPGLPMAPTALITASKGGAGRLAPAVWFAEAVKAQIDYSKAWSNFRDASLPRWGGSHAQMLQLANECLREDLRNTGVPKQGFLQIWQVWDDMSDGYGPPPARLWRATLTRFADRFVADAAAGDWPADGSPADWAWQVGALASGLAAEGMTDRQLAVLRAWPREGAGDLRAMMDGYRRDWIAGPLAAAGGDAADAAAKIAAAFDADAPVIPEADLPSLREAVDSVRAAADGDPVQVGWLEDVEAMLEMLESVLRGKTYGIGLRPGLPGWRCGAEWIEVTTSDDAPRGVADLYGAGRLTTPYLSPLAKLPEPFALMAKFQVVPIAGTNSHELGIGMGRGPWQVAREADLSKREITGAMAFLYDYPPGSPDTIGFLSFPWDFDRQLNAARGARYIKPDVPWVGLGVLAAPSRAAMFVGGRYHFRTEEGVPETLQPVRLGYDELWNVPMRFRIKEVIVTHEPDYRAPWFLKGVPENLRGEPPPEAAAVTH